VTAIETHGLTKTYGAVLALHELDLAVERGEVFGFLGPNGAGKTTAIRLLLDLLRPTAGTIRVLGEDPARDGVALRRRIGYLAGDFVADGRQTAGQLLAFLGDLRGGVPAQRVDALAERLGLELHRPIRALSKGNRQKVGLVQAFMHAPELLILDEPTSGLDPLVQQTFLAMVREARDAGATVFMSSHVLSEVQAVADRAGLVRDGHLVTVDAVDALRERAPRRVEVRFAGAVPVEAVRAVPGVSGLAVTDHVATFQLQSSPDRLVKTLAEHPIVDLMIADSSLEEIVLGYYGQEASHVA
jgi:ABC-2 type transport system ATP-binding protein